MKKEYLYGIIGLLSGILITVIFASNAVNANNQQMMKMMGMRSQHIADAKNEGMMDMHSEMMEHDGMSMNGMVGSLEGLSGEEFDRVFIEQMIPHHQGAIDMAELALENAYHQEIKDLAEDIITAQEEEIMIMEDWQQSWGY